MPGRRNRATRLSGVPDNPGTARDGDPGQDGRQAGHGQTDPFFAGPEAVVAQVTTPTAGTGAEPGGSPAPTRT